MASVRANNLSTNVPKPRNPGSRGLAGNLFLFFCFVASMTMQTTASAQQRKPVTVDPAQRLLALDHRPTVAEILDALGGKIPKHDPHPFGPPTSGLGAKILDSVPSVIAAFEKAFPGAKFAAVGRDSAFLGDVIDAYYRSRAQNGRVTRLNVSGLGTSKNEEESSGFQAVRRDDLVDHLKSAGFDLAGFESRPPFILFDQTFFESGSQTKAYLKAVYFACQQRPGCDPALLLEKFNVINTGPARKDEVMYRHNIFSPTTDMELFLLAREADLNRRSSYGQQVPDGYPDAIISVRVDPSLIYTAEYHDKFGRLARLADGSVGAQPGPMNTPEVRLQILADTLEAIQIVSSPDFHAKVEAEASRLGYSFPVARPTAVSSLNLVDRADTEMKRILTYMADPTLDHGTKRYLLELQMSLHKRTHALKENQRSFISETVIKAVLEATSFDQALARAVDVPNKFYVSLVATDAVVNKLIAEARLEWKIPEALNAFETTDKNGLIVIDPFQFVAFAHLESARTAVEFLDAFGSWVEESDVFGTSMLRHWREGVDLIVRLFLKAGGTAETLETLVKIYETSEIASSLKRNKVARIKGANFSVDARSSFERQISGKLPSQWSKFVGACKGALTRSQK